MLSRTKRGLLMSYSVSAMSANLSVSAAGHHFLLGQHFDMLVVLASAPLHSSCAGNLK